MAQEIATLAGGCFWCTEAVYQTLKGVESVQSGYIGGTKVDPTYEEVCTGNTGHAEAIRIAFDPAVISYADLLDIFFATHNPTTLNRQGNDVGTQYRSGIYYEDPAHGEAANAMVRQMGQDKLFGAPITTEVKPLANYSTAEDYHQDYFAKHPGQGYCAFVVGPKVEKFRKTFRKYLKED